MYIYTHTYVYVYVYVYVYAYVYIYIYGYMITAIRGSSQRLYVRLVLLPMRTTSNRELRTWRLLRSRVRKTLNPKNPKP